MGMQTSETDRADPRTAIVSAKTDDGQTVTFRSETVIAIVTAADRKTSTVMLDGGTRTTVKGAGEGLRRKVFGVSPADVQAAIKQQTAKKKGPTGLAA